ncbi:MAG: S-layer homology domain-containing protein, partial [Candidatus Riflebacteria bacterium]|nr:S-layer homology domain-containing protein [Candidatus Riflebacteria bacterium]
MRRVLLSLCFLFLCVVTAQSSQYYKDLPRAHWAYETVERLSEKGFLSGTADKKFNGDTLVTRYGMAQIVANILSRTEYISNVEKQPLTQDELIDIEELV